MQKNISNSPIKTSLLLLFWDRKENNHQADNQLIPIASDLDLKFVI